MTESITLRAVAAALSSMVREHTTTDALAGLLTDCAGVYPAAATAILVRDRREQLELLAASSHRAEELELLQLQHERGPCVDAIREGSSIAVAGAAALAARWGEVGEQIVASGYLAVHAYPLRWHGLVLGGLNIFLTEAEEPDAERSRLGQLFADVATLVVVQTAAVPVDEVATRVHAAVSARSLVEQAKGVLAYEHSVDVGVAYDLLVAQAQVEGLTLSAMAASTVERARRPQG